MKRFFRYLLFFLLNLGVCLGFGEFLLRVDGPLFIRRRVSIDAFNREFLKPGNREAGTALKPLTIGDIYGHKVKTNSLGFRGPEPKKPKKEEIRILVVGRSLAFGWGVDEQNAWPNVLERMLKKASKESIRVLNFSIPAWTIADVFVATFKYSQIFKPHILILPIHTDDLVFYDEMLVYLDELKKLQTGKDKSKKGFFDFFEDLLNKFTQSSFGENLCLKQIIINLWYKVLIARNLKRREYKQTIKQISEGIFFLYKVIDVLNNFCKKNDIYFIIFDMGGHKEIAEFCKLKGIVYRRGKIEWEKLKVKATLGFGDPHPNKYGHKLIAQKVFEAVFKIIKRLNKLKGGKK